MKYINNIKDKDIINFMKKLNKFDRYSKYEITYSHTDNTSFDYMIEKFGKTGLIAKYYAHLNDFEFCLNIGDIKVSSDRIDHSKSWQKYIYSLLENGKLEGNKEKYKKEVFSLINQESKQTKQDFENSLF